VQPPIPLYTPEPAYPEEARDAEVGGVVSLRLMVDASGCPASTWKETPKKALLDATWQRSSVGGFSQPPKMASRCAS